MKFIRIPIGANDIRCRLGIQNGAALNFAGGFPFAVDVKLHGFAVVNGGDVIELAGNVTCFGFKIGH